MPDSNHRIKHILLVDPDEAFGRVLQQVLGSGYALQSALSVEAGISQLDAEELDVVLLNLDLPTDRATSQDSRALLEATSERAADLPVIVYCCDKLRKRGIEALQHGAVDFLEHPLDVQELKFALDAACRRATLARDLTEAQNLLPSAHVEGLLGNSPAMEQVNEMVRKVAGVFTNILITGESGTCLLYTSVVLQNAGILKDVDAAIDEHLHIPIVPAQVTTPQIKVQHWTCLLYTSRCV